MKLAPIAAAVLLLAGCGGQATSAPTTPSTSTPATTTPTTPTAATSSSLPPLVLTTPTPTPKPTATALPLGATARIPNVDLTVSEYKGVYKVAVGSKSMQAVLVKSCVTKVPIGEQGILFSRSPWRLIGPDSEQYPRSSTAYQDSKSPKYPFSDDKLYQVGECVKGWIEFDTSEPVVQVGYANSRGDSATWALK